MKVEIQEAGPCQKRIKVTIPEEEVKKKLNEGYKEVSNMVNIPGFRKGRVPRRILEKRFGTHVEDKVKSDLIEESLHEVLSENEISPLGDPQIEDVNFENDQDFSFETVLEVKPDFELPDYKGLKVKREIKKVDDENIDYALQEVFEKTNKLVALEEGAVEEKDIVICDLKIESEGEEVLSKEDVYVYVGEDNVGNLKIEGLSEEILGKEPEDVFKIEQTLSDEFPEEEYRGKEGVITITVADIKRPKYKEPDDEWARENDYEDLDEVKGYLAKEIEKSFEEQADEALRESILDKLIEKVDFDLPPEMTKKSLEDQLNQERQLHKMYGRSEEEVEEMLEDSMEEWEKKTQRDIRIFFILEKIAKKEKIFVTEREVEEKIVKMAQKHNRNVEDLREEFENIGYLSRLRWQLKEQKAMDTLVDNAVIETVEVSGEEESESEESSVSDEEVSQGKEEEREEKNKEE